MHTKRLLSGMMSLTRSLYVIDLLSCLRRKFRFLRLLDGFTAICNYHLRHFWITGTSNWAAHNVYTCL